MPKTRAIISSESRRLAKETAKAHQESVTDQNRIEPSWLPQVAATLYVEHSEVTDIEAVRERGEGHRQKKRVGAGAHASGRHPGRDSAGGADKRQHPLNHGHDERQNQCKMTDFRYHGISPLTEKFVD